MSLRILTSYMNIHQLQQMTIYILVNELALIGQVSAGYRERASQSYNPGFDTPDCPQTVPSYEF